MKYAIVTVEWCLGKGIVVPAYARKSIDGNKVILHYDFISPVLTEKDVIEVYEHNSQELNTILNGEEWTEKFQVLV